jgi:hypothetical protein
MRRAFLLGKEQKPSLDAGNDKTQILSMTTDKKQFSLNRVASKKQIPISHPAGARHPALRPELQ